MHSAYVWRLLICLGGVCQLAMASHDEKMSQIDEILNITHVEVIHGQLIQPIAANAKNRIPSNGTSREARLAAEELQQKMLSLVTEALPWTKVKADYAAAYDTTFSEEEIADILKFYKSPAGRAMVEKMPGVFVEVRKRFTERISADHELEQQIRQLIREAFEKSRAK